MTVQYDGQEIYENFKKGPGPGGLIASAEIVRTARDANRALADTVHQLALEIESAWEGDAGDAARRRATPMVAEHESAAHGLLTAEDLVSRQVESFIEAKNRVVPVPPAPTEVTAWRLDSPETAETFMGQVAAHLTAAQNNVDVMNGYTGASDHNTVNMPMSYGTLTSADVPLGQAGTWFDGPGGVSPGREAPSPGREVMSSDDAGARERTSPRDSAVPRENTRPGAGASPGEGADSPATQTDVRPLPATALPGLQPGLTTPAAEVSTGAVTDRIGQAGLSTVGEPPRPLGVVGAPAPHGGTRTPGGTEAYTRRTPGEPRTATAARTGATRGGHLGGLPVGTSRRDDDTERRAPAYLEERDPEALFGADDIVAPATIGLDET